MNNQFKKEFQNLDVEQIKYILNRCAGQDILQDDISHGGRSCFIKYIEDDSYGFWTVQWRWEKFTVNNTIWGGEFKNKIKITPFKVEFENTHSEFNPFSNANRIKQATEYLQLYIHKKCPTYVQAIREETESFIQMLEGFNKSNQDENVL